uniref:Calmodulin-binding transcription activator 1 n=1 Tax=Echeneis naucrates TaxID=173247 RepID=A0A665VL77_ECHNA
MHIKATTNNNEHGHLKIYLPKKLLECLPKCTSLPKERHRWNTNEEIAAYLITFEKHEEWLTTSPKTRPQNGSMILYNRKKVKYRKDGYCWKKRKDGKTTREDHMKLKVQGVECLYGCYVHSSIIPTFHRRCYWLLQNPDIVLVHYLNVPAIEDCGKPCGPILCSINTDKKEWAKWTKEELIGQLKPMFHGIKWTCSNGNSSSGFSVEQLVQQILDSHQTKPPPRTHNCLCTGTLGAGSSVHHKCNSAKHRIISPKVDPRSGGYSSAHSEVQNNDVSEGKTEHSAHGGGKSSGGGGGDPVYSMSPTGGPNTHLMGADATSQGLVLSVTSDRHKFAFPSGGVGEPGTTAAGDSLSMLSTAGVAEELVLSSSLDSGTIKIPETNMNFDPDCFLNNPKQGQTYGGSALKTEGNSSSTSSSSGGSSSTNGNLQRSPTMSDNGYTFSSALVKNIKTEDTSFEQQLAKESGYQVGAFHPFVLFLQGGVKVLITGPWQEASSNYSCLFDQISVPASLIQPGVLRCYCPAHDTGLVTLQVAVSNQIISNSVVFEYKARALPSLPSSQHDWLSLDDNQFRMSILERLEQMERRMAEMASHQQPSSTGSASSSFESRVVVVCEKMMSRACWAKSKHLIHSKTFRGMTLLHLAAGQGYATLIQTLIKWRTKHADSIDLELEVDPLNVDHFSCTPLMWACALGHLEAAVVLYKWDRRALAIPDSLGRLPLSIARSRGHTKLAECLEQLQREEQQPPAPLPPTTRMSFSPGPDAPTTDSWMVSWANDSVVAPSGKKGGPVNMMTLAEHIIEATPERIKRENFTAADSVPLDTSGVSNTMNWLANYLGDVEQLPSIIHLRSTLPSPADWSEFINASNSKVERDLAQLTLSDPEQRELYEAARLVQTAFRKYKGRPLREQQEVAAAVIQRCYKKYKQLCSCQQYALYKKMTQAAILIQSKFRSYHEQKKFQQSRRAAVLIQQYYRSYKEFGRLKPHHRGAAAALVQGSLLTKRQDQAARKIMRFLRRCRHR